MRRIAASKLSCDLRVFAAAWYRSRRLCPNIRVLRHFLVKKLEEHSSYRPSRTSPLLVISTTASTTRSMPRPSKVGYYAVKMGRKPGIYMSWDECEEQVKGFHGARYKKLNSNSEAEAYMNDTLLSPSRRLPMKPSGYGSGSGSFPSSTTSSSTLRSSGSESVDMEKVTVSPVTREQIHEDEASFFIDKDGENVVYCDGACKGNGQPGSVAGSGVWWGENDPRNLAERCPGGQTNNRAELFAVIRVLETAPITRKKLVIKTDSRYTIDCFQSWLPKWQSTGFRTSSGSPVVNKALILYLSALLARRGGAGQRVELQHVKGHSGVPGNESADRLATLGATLAPRPEKDWDALRGVVEAETRAEAERASAKTREVVAQPKVTAVDAKDVDFSMYADAMLSDAELEAMAANDWD